MTRPRILSIQTLAVLHEFLRDRHRQRYGLEMGKTLELPSGVIYPILRRLEDRGWLASGWEQIDQHEAGRPARRWYILTDYGVTQATNALQMNAHRLVSLGLARITT